MKKALIVISLVILSGVTGVINLDNNSAQAKTPMINAGVVTINNSMSEKISPKALPPTVKQYNRVAPLDTPAEAIPLSYYVITGTNVTPYFDADVNQVVAFNLENKKFHHLQSKWARKHADKCIEITLAEALSRGGKPCRGF